MKKIAFYIGNLNKGGAQRVVTNLANYFNKEGYEVLLVTFDRNEIEFPYDEGIKRILSNLTDEELSASKGKGSSSSRSTPLGSPSAVSSSFRRDSRSSSCAVL